MPALKENNNLVLLQMDPNHVKTLKELNVVRAIFKVEANVDSHMEREDDVNEINIKEVNMVIFSYSLVLFAFQFVLAFMILPQCCFY